MHDHPPRAACRRAVHAFVLPAPSPARTRVATRPAYCTAHCTALCTTHCTAPRTAGYQADMRYKETVQYMKPLFSRLKNRTLSEPRTTRANDAAWVAIPALPIASTHFV